jgi:hypothetical protein
MVGTLLGTAATVSGRWLQYKQYFGPGKSNGNGDLKGGTGLPEGEATGGLY